MHSLPLRDFEFVRTQDLEYVRDLVGWIFVPHDLRLVGRRSRLDARVHARRLGDMAFTYISYGGEVLIEPGAVNTFFAVQVPMVGTGVFSCSGKEVVATRSVAAVVSPDDDLVMRWHEGCAQLVCRIERTAVEAYLAGLLGEPLHGPLRFMPALRLDRGRGASVADGVRAITREIDRGGPAVNHPLSIRAIEQELMADLLVTQRHNYSETLHADVKPVGSRAVRGAVALLESHPEWPLTLANIATAVSVSGRSLERGFQRELNTTFRAVLHDIRLRRVRDELRRASHHYESVTDVIARWGLPLEGYTFNAYRRRYGESPLETLHRPT